MRRFLLLVALAWAAGCAPQPQLAPAVPSGATSSARAILHVRAADAPRDGAAEPTVYVELAETFADRRKGLSDRDALPPDGGMLFVYPRAEQRFFWMRGCRIGLDIAFLDEDGTVLQRATLPPGEDKEGLEIPSVESEHPIRFVLETAAGWLERKGIGVGDRVDFAEVVEGVDPE